jgi:signal transduction histidine kinase
MGEANEVVRRQEALLQAGLVLASELSLPTVLQKIVELACDVSDARYGALGVLAPGGDRLEDFVTHGVTEEERRAIGSLPVGRGILGALIEEAHPLRLRRIQDDPRSVGFPAHHPPMTSFLGVPMTVRGRVYGNLYLTEKRGAAEFTEEDERAVVTLAAQAAVAVENARLYQEAQDRQRRLEAVNEVIQAILGGRDTDDVLRLIAGDARELMGADVATVATPEPDGETMMLRVAEGAHAADLAGRHFPISESMSGAVMRTGQPLVVSDASIDPRVYQPIVQLGEMGPALFVPLAARGQVFGTLALSNTQGGREFTEEDLALVQVFAAQAAVALDYARIQQELKRLAVLEDRERIAKDLHDGVVQSLFAVGMALQAAEVVTEEEAVRPRLAGAVEDIDRVIRDLRNYIFGLRPGEAADRELDRALLGLVEDFRKGTDVAIRLDLDPEAAGLLAGKASDLVQVVREAVSNAIRHAGAQSLAVVLGRRGTEAVLEVEDDGKGFDLDQARGRGQGLANLEARARALGGRLEIESAAGDGTTVRILVPV